MTLVSNNRGYKDSPSPHRILCLVARHKKNNELSKSDIQDAQGVPRSSEEGWEGCQGSPSQTGEETCVQVRKNGLIQSCERE